LASYDEHFLDIKGKTGDSCDGGGNALVAGALLLVCFTGDDAVEDEAVDLVGDRAPNVCRADRLIDILLSALWPKPSTQLGLEDFMCLDPSMSSRCLRFPNQRSTGST